jgi:hypothetical protein
LPPPTPSRDSPAAAAERALIKTKLDEEEARLQRLELEREEAKARLVALRTGLAALDEDPVQQHQSGLRA